MRKEKVDRLRLLGHLAQLAPDEDTSEDIARVFLPLPVHALALRPDVIVIQGTRGAGKTALFRLVQELKGDIRSFFNDPSIPSATWLDGYSETSITHPSAIALDALVARVGEDDQALRAFWAVHLLTRLAAEGVPGVRVPLAVEAAQRESPGDPTSWISTANQTIAAVMAALDDAERTLAGRGQLVFVSYDHLDRIGVLAEHQSTRRRLVRALLSLWLSSAARYRHLRAKVFLRPDLFDEAEASFPDASKLRPRSVLLTWDVASLYQLAIRHLLNRGPAPEIARVWVEDMGIPWKDSGPFGAMPATKMDVREQKTFAEHLAGETMGSGSRKGFTYRWIPARLRDAGGAIVPRSLLRLLRHAAKDTLTAGPPTSGPLMDPSRLVGALQQTSKDRVSELTEEYPLVRRLDRLQGAVLLMERRDVISELRKRPPDDDGYGDDGGAVFDELRRIGVLDTRSDGRVDVPDIYRYGFGIKRRGGTKAPR